MLNLPSFNHLLPISNTSSHLLKGLMATALLSLSFISLSSHAATSNSVSPISRAEAANPSNFKFLSVNGGAVTYASAPCSITKGLIACGLEKLKLINSSIDEVDADYDLAQAFYYPSKAQPRTAVVVISSFGLMDDSVRAERYRISFKLEDNPSGLSWNWVQYGVQYQCARGSKAGKWTKELCP